MADQDVPQVCPACHMPVSPGAKFCGRCGATLALQRTCSTCGAKLTENDRFCTVCGSPVAQPVPQPAPLSTTDAEQAPTPGPVRPAVMQSPPPSATPSYQAQPVKRKSSLPLVIIAVVVVLCLAGAAIGAKAVVDRLQGLLRGEGLTGLTDGQSIVQSTVKPPVSQTGSATVGSDGGTISLDGGPEVEIPAGAVAAGDDGSINPIRVKISRSNRDLSLPDNMPGVGDVYEIGPAGTTFAVAVRVTLPVPEGADMDDILGLATLDEDTGEWVSVGSTVDKDARTVSGYATHFSPWSIVGGRSEAAKYGGWIKIVNNYTRGSSPFPGCQHLPMHLENGVCFTSHTPKSPDNLVKPSFNQLIAFPQKTVEYWLPVGTYTLEDFIFASEINNNPTYSPCRKWWTKAPQTIVIRPGTTIVFGEDRSDTPPKGFTEVPNSCAPADAVSATSTPGGTVTPSSDVVEIYDNGNIGGVYNGATEPTTFTIDEPWLITEISDYHWNEAKGVTPGTIGLRAEDGTMYGPWEASGAEGMGGVPDAYWIVRPDEVIPAGTYTVVDSDPATWSQNSETGGAGMTKIMGIRQPSQ